MVVGEPLDSSLDAVYVHDPAAVTEAGAVLLRPGKVPRRAEVDAIERDLRTAGIAVLARLEEPATAEGGDMLWLDGETLVVGRGYRPNDAEPTLRGVPARRRDRCRPSSPPRSRRGDAPVLPDQPARRRPRGRSACPDARAVCRVARVTRIELVHVPDGEFETMACNVLALAPRRALALDGNPETRRRTRRPASRPGLLFGRRASRKGDGGLTCLTRPLLRGA